MTAVSAVAGIRPGALAPLCPALLSLSLARSLALWLLLHSAGAAAHPGHHDQLQHANDSIAEQPLNQRHYLRRAVIHREGGELALAAADLERAEQLGAPERAAYERASLYYQRGDLAAAQASVDRYLQAFPQSFPAWELRGTIAVDSGNPERAISDLQRAISLQERANPGSYVRVARLLAATQQVEPALAFLDQGMQQLGTVPQLQREAVALELSRDNLAGAITRLETLREPLRANAEWKLELAELLLRDRQVERGRAMLLEVVMDSEAQRPSPAALATRQRAQDLLEAPHGDD